MELPPESASPPAPTLELRMPEPGRAGSRGPARARPWIEAGLVLGLLVAAALIFKRELGAVRYDDVVRTVHALPAWRLALALLATAAAYSILPVYDLFALRHLQLSIGKRRTLFTAAIALAISQTLGFATVTGSSIRYRFWSAWGLSGGQVARALGFVWLTHGIGMLLVPGVLVLGMPKETAELLHLPPLAVRALAALAVLPVLVYLVLVLWRPGQRLSVFGRELVLPGRAIALAQVGLPFADWLFASAALYVLLDPASRPSFGAFAAAFTLAQVLGLVSHSPGGLGVFDGSMLLLLKPYAPTEQILATLLVFRCVYYLLPFALGALGLAGLELWSRRSQVALARDRLAGLRAAFAPPTLAVATFVCGLALLFSGATPADPARLARLHSALPLWALETAHLAGSLIGTLLVALSFGLRHRLALAWRAAVPLLALGAAASLLKGLDYGEAGLLALVLGLASASGQHFRRRSRLFSEPAELEWSLAAWLASVGTLWLGLFRYQHLEYSHDLWARFDLSGDPSRALRASAASLGLLAAIALVRLARRPRVVLERSAEPALRKAEALALAHGQRLDPRANRGDAVLWFSSGGRAALVFLVLGRTWLALGEPVGEASEGEELAWRFELEARRRGARAAFLGIPAARSALFLDLGLTLSPLPRTPGTSSTAIPGPARFLAVPADQGRQRVLADLEAWIEDESFA
jgi:phosphatidylglycerol lysyltransferase